VIGDCIAHPLIQHGEDVKRQPKTPLYYTYSRFNEPTMTVDPGEWFEVETQMNRGPDADRR